MARTTFEILEKLEHDINELKKEYELYFQGINKIPPEREFGQMQKVIRAAKAGAVGSAALKFRLSSIVSKFQSYSRYWYRIMREIEEGRYHRDKFKAELRGAALESPASVRPKSVVDDENRFGELHKAFMMARLECNQGVEGVSREKLKSSIEKSLPSLKKKYPGKKIEFKVVVENGKAKLKAIPK